MNISQRAAIGLVAGSFVAACSEDVVSAVTGPIDYLVPSVDRDALALKIWFTKAQSAPPRLLVDNIAVTGRPLEPGGIAWVFEQGGLASATSFRLDLFDGANKRARAPWRIKTLPGPNDRVDSFRILFFTCAGGDPAFPGKDGKTAFLDLAARTALLDRALALQPDLVVANGDHIYWDQASNLEHLPFMARTYLRYFYGRVAMLDDTASADSEANRRALTAILQRQIAPVYRDRLAAFPTVFVADDHDYFENDIAGPWGATFPPKRFLLAMQRATARLAYPVAFGRPAGMSQIAAETVERIRIGRLVDLLLYDCRRGLRLGKEAVFLDPAVEAYLKSATADQSARHLVHVPSTPFGWSAGKWGEWYADRGQAGLYGDPSKELWQPGWFAQHQRLIESLSRQPGRAAVAVSGDLHASAAARIMASGDLDLSPNPITTILAGTIGTGQLGFPSVARGMGAVRPQALHGPDLTPLRERNGFSILDFTADQIEVSQFSWLPPQPISMIRSLMPDHKFSIPHRG